MAGTFHNITVYNDANPSPVDHSLRSGTRPQKGISRDLLKRDIALETNLPSVAYKEIDSMPSPAGSAQESKSRLTRGGIDFLVTKLHGWNLDAELTKDCHQASTLG